MSPEEIRQGFAQAQQHISAIGKTIRHNSGVVSRGFYANDVWTHTLRLALADIAANQKKLAAKLDVELSGEWKGDQLDTEAYFNAAQAQVQEQIEQSKKLEEAQSKPSLVERAADEEVVEFGGDYGSKQDKTSS